MHIKGRNLPWYREGLRFECQRCGRCCRGEPGMVWMDKKEIKRISSFLGITQDVFAKLYLRIVNGRISLLECNNGDCIMYYEDGCKIYSARPYQCKTFPFWRSNLGNRNEWEKQKNTCPGIGKGRLHKLNDIENYLKPDLSGL
jgi:uncharacterized protein